MTIKKMGRLVWAQSERAKEKTMSSQPQRILKYQLEIADFQSIYTTLIDPVPVLVAEQNGEVCLWLKGYQGEENTIQRIRMFGTGHWIPSDQGLEHIGSVSMSNGFVWHVFSMP